MLLSRRRAGRGGAGRGGAGRVLGPFLEGLGEVAHEDGQRAPL